MAEALILFAREPRLGGVKRRLAKELGEPAALRIHRRMMLRALRLAAAAARHRPACRLWVAFDAPEGSSDDLRRAARDHGARAFEQPAGSLGERMRASMSVAAETGARRIVLFGCDCPAMRPSDLVFSLDALTDHPFVLGPVRDGGYWLIGMREVRAQVFSSVPWGTAEVASGTRARAALLGWTTLSLPVREDVDRPEDWRRWIAARAARGLAESARLF